MVWMVMVLRESAVQMALEMRELAMSCLSELVKESVLSCLLKLIVELVNE